MPQVAVVVWIALMDVGLSVAAANAVMFVLKFIATTAASMAASKLLAPKAPSYSDPSLTDRSQMIRSPIAARQIVYGQTKTSGVIVYISTTGTKNEYLHLVVAMAGHEVEEIGDVYFNDELALTGAGSAAQGRFTGYAEIYKKLGSDTQTVETNLETATSGLIDGKWTSNHRLRGIAYIYVRLVWNQEVWTGGIPNIAAVVKGKKVYDPRTTTTAYSANPALCLRDYLTSSLGMAMDSAEIDDTAISAAANICDEDVEIKPVTSPATYENRYEANGVLYTSASPDENIGKLITAMGGLIAYSGGKVVVYAAGYRIPTVTLTEKHFAGQMTVQTKTSARDRVNGVKGVYVSPENDWQPSDFPQITSTTYVTKDAGIRYWRDVALPFTTSPACAQRLAVIELRRAREEITMTARFRLEAMQVRAGDTVMITNSKMGWTQKVFEVMEWNFASDGNPPQLAIEMTLRETASTVYDWTVNDEIYVDDAPNTTLPNPFTLSAPTNLTLTADGTTQQIQADGTALPRILVSWSAPAEEFIQAGGNVGIEYKESTSTTYLTWNTLPGDQTRDYISSDVKIGLTYNVRIFGESFFKVSTSYVTATVNVQKDTVAPSIPTSLVATIGTGSAVGLDWDDSTAPDFSEYGIYRNTTGVTPANANTNKIAEVDASRFVDVDVAVGTTYYYWVNAYDALENVSGFATRVQATPVAITAGAVSSVAPSTPNAPTYASETTYLASDGTAVARITVTAPAMPTGGAVLQILYRRSGASEWVVANVLSSGSIAASIDDLFPGVAYEFAARALSFSNAASSISSTLSRTAPNYSGTVTTPTGGTITSDGVKPKYFPGTTSFVFGTRVGWAANTQSDFAYYEVKATTTDSDGATNYSWTPLDGANFFVTTRATECFLYSATLSAGYVRVRAVNRTGTASAWASLGNANAVGNASIGTGDISKYDDSDVTTTGIKTGGGSSTRQINVIFSDSVVVTLAGGATTESFNVSLTNRGFGAKPDIGTAQCASDANLVAAYDFDAAGNSSTNAVVRVTTLDGTNVPAGNARFSVEFTEYT
jgi:hypothetical protein